MLELKNIVKNYPVGDTVVQALKGIDLTFGKSEFVSILGPSGCGKTTLLNIIGGLDRYTDGDLIINGTSTKMYKNADWDAYRNRSIGFVFQNYNLIPHLTVLGNVEMAMTLSGVTLAERKKRASEALSKVGLENQLNKKPNQLSGGQMQRVAIARAIVNNPEIILADEPTGALDSVTSVQIADLLKEISKDRLIIMVTHNDKLAEKYSTRIIRLLDGVILNDTKPQSGESVAGDAAGAVNKPVQTAPAHTDLKEGVTGKKPKKNKTSMSFFTALSLSFKNLITKKGRTFMTSFAGSIGIIGIALVLAVSNGFTVYIDKMQSDMLSGFPLSIGATAMDVEELMSGHTTEKKEKFPTGDTINIYTPEVRAQHENIITQNYIDNYVKTLDKSLYNSISYTSNLNMNVLSKSSSGIQQIEKPQGSMMEMMQQAMLGQTSSFWTELLPESDFVLSQYDVLAGHYPTQKNELAIVIDQYNRLSSSTLAMLNIDYEGLESYRFDDLINKKEFSLIMNNDFYTQGSNGNFAKNAIDQGMYDKGEKLQVVAVMRIKEESPLELFGSGLMYTPQLTEFALTNAKDSDLAKAQLANDKKDVITGNLFSQGALMGISAEQLYKNALFATGAVSMPASIQIYPKSFDSKEKIKSHLNTYNTDKEKKAQIFITDAAEMLTDTMNNMVNIISYVLVSFAAISLVVSSIMIGIITYVSVIERTKEIGVLRSIGARKKDISRVFNAETLIIGFAAGVIGILISFILTFPINAVITAVVAQNGMSVGNMALMDPIHALILVVVSMALTLIAGLIPSRLAAKKDPVVALRSE